MLAYHLKQENVRGKMHKKISQNLISIWLKALLTWVFILFWFGFWFLTLLCRWYLVLIIKGEILRTRCKRDCGEGIFIFKTEEIKVTIKLPNYLFTTIILKIHSFFYTNTWILQANISEPASSWPLLFLASSFIPNIGWFHTWGQLLEYMTLLK